MKITKPSVRQWNTTLKQVLYCLGSVKYVINHALYNLNTTSTKDVLVVV